MKKLSLMILALFLLSGCQAVPANVINPATAVSVPTPVQTSQMPEEEKSENAQNPQADDARNTPKPQIYGSYTADIATEYSQISIDATVSMPLQMPTQSSVIDYNGALDIRILDAIGSGSKISEQGEGYVNYQNNRYIYRSSVDTSHASFSAIGYGQDYTNPVSDYKATGLTAGFEQAQSIADDLVKRIGGVLNSDDYQLSKVAYYAQGQNMPSGMCEFWYAQKVGDVPIYEHTVVLGRDKDGAIIPSSAGLQICVNDQGIFSVDITRANLVGLYEHDGDVMPLGEVIAKLEKNIYSYAITDVNDIVKIDLSYKPVSMDKQGNITLQPIWCFYPKARKDDGRLLFDALTGDFIGNY